jgi:RNA recognition motif-containing protein
MAAQRDGETAIAALDGYLLNGRNLRVNQARPRTERPKRRNDDWY